MAPIFENYLFKSLLVFLLFNFSHGESKINPVTPVLKETKMSVYFQDQIGGPNFTGIAVAGIQARRWSFTDFGTIMVIDDPLTLGLARNSTQVGRCQSLFTTAALDGSAIHVLVHLIFSNREFNGSTLMIQGASVLSAPVREVAVVSGTGKFRYARGYGTFETILVDQVTGYNVVRFNFTVQYP